LSFEDTALFPPNPLSYIY